MLSPDGASLTMPDGFASTDWDMLKNSATYNQHTNI